MRELYYIIVMLKLKEQNIGHREEITACIECGNEFVGRPNITWGLDYCSRHCFDASRGIYLTDEEEGCKLEKLNRILDKYMALFKGAMG